MKTYQVEYDKKYCYPETNILKNKFNIINSIELHDVERNITNNRLVNLMVNPVKGNLDFSYLQKIHYNIFYELYDWAGKMRTVNIAKGNLFCTPDFILDMSNTIFKKLQSERYLIGLSQEDICKKLAYYTGEINALHPFREGNGRTQREFMRCLGAIAGYEVDFTPIGQKEMIQASIASFDCEYKQMEELYSKIVRPLSAERHQILANAILEPNGNPDKIFRKFMDEVKERKQPLKKDISLIKEIKQAGFQPTKKLQDSMRKLDKVFGSHKTVREIRDLYKNKENLSPEEKKVVEGAGKDFMQQEKSNIPFLDR